MARKRKKSSGKSRLSKKQRYIPAAKATGDVGGETIGSTLKRRQVTRKATTRIPTEEELAEEYRYVLTDLKKIGWLALAMLALLIALAFIIV